MLNSFASLINSLFPPENIFNVIESGDILKARKLLNSNPSLVDEINPDGYTPLNFAVKKKNKKFIELFLSRGVNINKGDEYGKTPLHIASHDNSPEVAEFLIKKGADVKAGDGGRWTPLHSASVNGSKYLAELLIKKGADVNAGDDHGETPLHLASRDISENLITFNNSMKRIKPDWQELYPDYKGVMELLLSSGADINARNKDGETPLCRAAVSYKEASELLISRGADIHSRNNSLWTVLHLVSLHGPYAVAETLIEKGANVNAKDSICWTPLHSAAANGNRVVAEMLINKGADVNGQAKHDYFDPDDGAWKRNNENSWTPLHIAAKNNRDEVVELLISKGADVNAELTDGRTPLDLCKDRDLRMLLRDRGGIEGKNRFL
ncbi:MAG: ankyrin repeat domain-containing protein [Candidatus Eremiobacterota bacterium]